MNIDGFEYMATRDAAAYLNITQSALHDALHKHPTSFRVRLIGRSMVWSVEDIFRYADSRRATWQGRGWETRKATP